MKARDLNLNWIRDWPIRRKLTLVIMVVCGLVVLLACLLLGVYQIYKFREGTVRETTLLADILAKNTQAALAFEDEAAAQQTLEALQVDSYVTAACLYDGKGAPFAKYIRDGGQTLFPDHPAKDSHHFEIDSLVVTRPVMLNNRQIGTIYLQTSLDGLYERLRLLGGFAVLVLLVSGSAALALSSRLQRPISQPILALTETARRISADRDFTVRLPPHGRDEVGQLTDAFNQLLSSIEERDRALRTANGLLRVEVAERKGAEDKVQAQLGRLELLHRITRAVAERQDLQSIFQVVIQTLEEHLPVDFSCFCVYDPAANILNVTRVGKRDEELARKLRHPENSRIEIGQNGMAKCVEGELVFEPDLATSAYPFFKLLSDHGLRSMVAAPLLVESKVFGVLLSARKEPDHFSSGECEFLRQLSEHVALAAHQTQLYEALHQAYDNLRQTQQAVMQQERLRVLGQMASGIAHDINNAISPVALYTESLLENEPSLSVRARDYLETIQHAIEDVTQTVSRMKEFYRQPEPLLTLMPVQLNRLIRQVIDLSRARWNDIPQQRGIVITLETELAPELPAILGVESEIREALVNLIFNAVDAMPEGGKLTLRSKVSGRSDLVSVEVSDTGVGMSEETRRRCFEPFFTTKGERGTGLGLAMVHGIARRNNSDIEIESALGEGTTVRLVFPVPAMPVADTPSSATPFTVPTRLRLLIVDDDPLLIKSMRDTLESDGHLVITASGGREGIEVFREARERGESFAAVITDLGMPHVNGRQVALEIKNIEPNAPVILLTGWGQRLVAEGDIPPYVDRILNKPPKLRELREALAECLLPPKL
jgi:signal transduction histidine kinase/ActR/RegA family two-component response regulator